MERRWMRDIERALNVHGITVVSYQNGKKHVKVRITDGKVTRFIVTSASPSDVKTLRNIVSTAKKTLSVHIGE